MSAKAEVLCQTKIHESRSHGVSDIVSRAARPIRSAATASSGRWGWVSSFLTLPPPLRGGEMSLSAPPVGLQASLRARAAQSDLPDWGLPIRVLELDILPHGSFSSSPSETRSKRVPEP